MANDKLTNWLAKTAQARTDAAEKARAQMALNDNTDWVVVAKCAEKIVYIDRTMASLDKALAGSDTDHPGDRPAV